MWIILSRTRKSNCSRIVDKSDPESKRAELEYKVLDCIQTEEKESPILKSGRNKAAHRQASSDPGFSFPVMEPPFMEMANTEIMKKL